MSSLNLTNNFPSRPTTGVFTGGSGNANNIAYSSDNGITWTANSGTFSFGGNDIAWNVSLLVAVGDASINSVVSYNSICTSPYGNDWTGTPISNRIFKKGNGVAWNGTCWIAVGESSSTNNYYSIGYSYDGNTWYQVNNSKSIFTTGYGVAGNPGIGPVFVDSQLVLNNFGNGLSSNLDIVSDTYYNSGYTNFSMNCT